MQEDLITKSHTYLYSARGKRDAVTLRSRWKDRCESRTSINVLKLLVEEEEEETYMVIEPTRGRNNECCISCWCSS
jgi:hypothetical protein